MRVVLVDPQKVYRDTIAASLEGIGGSEVVAEADTGESAIACILRYKPDIAIVELAIPGVHGFSVISATQNQSKCRIVVTTHHCEEYTVHRLEKARVWGYVHKNPRFSDEIGNCLLTLRRNNIYFDAVYRDVRYRCLANPQCFLKLLSPREMVVFSLIGRGHSDDEIAVTLGRSPRTVQGHRNTISRKLRIYGGQKLTLLALELGVSLFP